jgi:exopolysaccharide biosynthesis polyprenyl glycosylphosphotransferase
MNKIVQAFKYIISDWLMATLAWTVFFVYRKSNLEQSLESIEVILKDPKLHLGLLIIPFFWFCLYLMQGQYSNVFRKSRLTETGQTFLTSAFGTIIIFFTLLINDYNHTYYKSIAALFIIHFTLTALVRFIITSQTAHKIHRRIYGFNSIIVGSGNKAVQIFNELESMKKSMGNKFLGYVSIEEEEKNAALSSHLNQLGSTKDLKEIIEKYQIEEVILAGENHESEIIKSLLSKLEGKNIIIKTIPDMEDILAGSVKMNSILGAALIEISPDHMPQWEKSAKRAFDIVFSICALTLGSPLYLTLAILVKTSSNGPIFFLQERIGIHGKPFFIIKFRTMFIDAEKMGPALSKDNDPRITKTGRILRKTRLDELPQFWNVLKGDMSVVGPRPERQFYIKQIVEKAPQYYYLQKVKPGVTSWGQVKYGYAENVEEMIERLKFDLIYMENRSLIVDFKIIIHTILIVVQGRGK